MKLAIVAPGGFDRSGQERVTPALLWLVERLAREHEVHVYTLYQEPRPGTWCLRGATIHNVGAAPGPLRSMRAARAAIELLRREHRRGAFDAIHGIFAGESGFAAAVAGRLLGVRTVVTVAGGELVELPDIGYGGQLRARSRWVIAAALRLAAAVTTGSHYMLQRVAERRTDAQVVVLGVPADTFLPSSLPSFLPSFPRLLHVASLNRVKDQPTLLRAFARIREALPEARLNVVGEDTLGGEVQRLAASLGLANHVTFHGFQLTEAVAVLLRRSDLLLHSSRSECGQVCVLEAATCGVPTVGTAVGLVPDMAPDAAVAVPVGDDAALARAALDLLADAPRRCALGEAARAFALQHDADATVREFVGLYAAR